MGNFYTNITLRTERHDDVVAALRDLEREAYVSPADKGCVVVFDQETEDQDFEGLKKLAGALSSALRCPALAVLVHDDDILMYSLHEDGKQRDEYNSSPSYFEGGPGAEPEGGDPAVLCRAFGVASISGVEEVLHTPRAAGDDDGYVFEHERHEALVEALRIPAFAVACGFNYLEEGECPDGTTPESFTRV